MKFEELATLLECRVRGLDSKEFVAVTEDSRNAKPGTLFAAVVGEHSNGHDFIADAKARGAVAVLGERRGIGEIEGLPYIHVPHARRAAGLLAHSLAGDPTKEMTVVGVTGTNGKSSTVFLLHHIFQASGIRSAHLGTLGYFVGEQKLEAKHTTPFGEDLADVFEKAKASGCTHAVMEASSHAIEQERIAGTHFRGAVFTNLSQDHLDYHQTMDAYRDAKLKLFQLLEGESAFAIVNLADPAGTHFVKASSVPCFLYGPNGDCKAKNVRHERTRTIFEVDSPWGEIEIRMNLLGNHNVMNALAAITTAGALNISMEQIAEGIASLAAVPGRFEDVDMGQDFQVIIDYAHTDDGLRNVLEAAQNLHPNRVILVFGCGGDRDKGKRPRMAAVAAELADYSIITSDNPRTEDPERILLDIESGIQRAGMKKDDNYLMILDRREAIETAIQLAKPNDLVLIAGKGHEDYQILGTERIHFDDREVAREALEQTGRQ